MQINRIKGILWQEFFITRRSLEVLMDILFFPAINVIVFGFISVFLTGKSTSAANYLLVGIILWQIIYITQYSISVGSLWNIWSRNLSNMFITPISVTEYMAAYIFSGIIKAFLIFLIFGTISIPLFNFNVFQLGPTNLILYFINLVLFACSTGIAILAAIFRYGTRIQSLAWGLVFLFQPLSAAFFPLSVLPIPLQKLALLFPPTYVFEAAREALEKHNVNWQMIGISLTLNLVYLVLAIFFFNYMFKKAKDTGQFARNEG
jgi:ABC-2 type transport system permease protein